MLGPQPRRSRKEKDMDRQTWLAKAEAFAREFPGIEKCFLFNGSDEYRVSRVDENLLDKKPEFRVDETATHTYREPILILDKDCNELLRVGYRDEPDYIQPFWEVFWDAVYDVIFPNYWYPTKAWGRSFRQKISLSGRTEKRCSDWGERVGEALLRLQAQNKLHLACFIVEKNRSTYELVLYKFPKGIDNIPEWVTECLKKRKDARERAAAEQIANEQIVLRKKIARVDGAD